MTRIIGHRGAAGLALENTIESFQRAFELGVDAVELDVHETADGQFVVCHDHHLKRVSDSEAVISELSYAELARIILHNGQPVPLLEQVLRLARTHETLVVVELKRVRSIDQFCVLLDQFQDCLQAVASFDHAALEKIKQLRPDYKLYLAENYHALEVVQKAHAMGASGIDLNFWLLNPLTYWLAKRYQLDLMVYTVNYRLIKLFITLLYPAVYVCTNVPHKFIAFKPPRR